MKNLIKKFIAIFPDNEDYKYLLVDVFDNFRVGYNDTGYREARMFRSKSKASKFLTNDVAKNKRRRWKLFKLQD